MRETPRCSAKSRHMRTTGSQRIVDDLVASSFCQPAVRTSQPSVALSRSQSGASAIVHGSTSELIATWHSSTSDATRPTNHTAGPHFGVPLVPRKRFLLSPLFRGSALPSLSAVVAYGSMACDVCSMPCTSATIGLMREPIFMVELSPQSPLPVPQSRIFTTTPAGGSEPEGCALSGPALCLIGGSTLPDESSSSKAPSSGSIMTCSLPSPCGGGSTSW
mmetsp:Transcript_59521/g.142912  ORF Transcript_59521/g.142912 Transcript_59521/m.142912 type:complete len:219 (+) Transcript_59521:646-1302(+)